MTATMQERILDTLNRAIPLLTDVQLEKLLSFGEGVLMMTESHGQRSQPSPDPRVRIGA